MSIFKSTSLGRCNIDSWFNKYQAIVKRISKTYDNGKQQLVSLTKTNAQSTSTTSNDLENIHCDITRDLHNQNIPIIVKIHLVACIEQSITKISQNVNIEILINALLDLLKNLTLNGDTSSFKEDNKSTLFLSFVHKLIVCLTNLLIFYDKFENALTLEHDISQSHASYITKFIHLLATQSDKFSKPKHPFTQQSLSIICSCIKELCVYTTVVSRSKVLQDIVRSSNNKLTAFFLTNDLTLLNETEIDLLIQQTEGSNCHCILTTLTAISDKLVASSTNSEANFTRQLPMTSIKEFISKTSEREDLELIHPLLFLMLKTRFRIFSPQSEISLMTSLKAVSFSHYVGNSVRLLALDIIRDLTARTSQPDFIYDDRLKPKQVDRIDTLEKKLCIFSMRQTVSDSEILDYLRDIGNKIAQDPSKNVRLANALYRIFSFIIMERPSMMYNMEDIIFDLGTSRCKLYIHTLQLLKAYPALADSISTRLIEYFIQNIDDIKRDCSRAHLELLIWLASKNTSVEKTQAVSLFSSISEQAIRQPSSYENCLKSLTDLLWKCSLDDSFKNLLKTRFAQMLTDSDNSIISVWIQLLYHGLQHCDSRIPLKDNELCTSYQDIDVNLCHSVEIENTDVQYSSLPFNVRRLDHINYVSFPPSTTSVKLLFSISLKQDCQDNFHRVFCLIIDVIHGDGETCIQTMEIPVLKIGSSKVLEVNLTPNSSNSFSIKTNISFTDQMARCYKYTNCKLLDMSFKDLIFPILPELNHPTRINFESLWSGLSRDRKTVETVIIVRTISSIQEFFELNPWLTIFKLDLQTNDKQQQVLCALPKERSVLMRVSVVNKCIKVSVLTNDSNILKHLFCALTGAS